MRQVHKLLAFIFLVESVIECRKYDVGEISEAFDALAQASKKIEENSHALKTEDSNTAACIQYFKVDAHTGSRPGASQNYRINPRLAFKLKDGITYSAELNGRKNYDSPVLRFISVGSVSPELSKCITQDDITDVYLMAPYGANDGWFVTSIDIYTAGYETPYMLLTSNPSLNKWVDYNDQDLNPYNTRLVPLKLPQVSEECITSLKIRAKTGDVGYAGFYRAPHKIVLQLNDRELQGNIAGPADRNQEFNLEIDITDFGAQQSCLKLGDITEVRLEAGGNDGWYINEITTLVSIGGKPYKKLTSDPLFNRWLDSDDHYEYDATRFVLSLHREHTPLCGFGVEVCECHSIAEVCIFNLEIDEIRTFTSYRKFPVEEGDGIFVRGTQGVIYEIASNGEIEPLEQYSGRHCAANFNPDDCSDPQFVDGKTYRMAIGVNGQIPGPTIIVHENQKVVIHVHNNMSTEGISIHWHGMHQIGTPWMDGVGQITQCQIGPSSSFTYIYTASPSGTFWYHSHSGAQRTDGFFGTLIVKERPGRLQTIKNELGLGDFEDHPGLHSASLLDWQHEASLDLFSQLNAGLGFHLDSEIGELPPSDKFSRYNSTRSYEEGEVGPVPYFSGLINGKGRHDDIPYVKTRLSVFPVERNKKYRFRLIGAQGLYAFKFSIDGHRLTVVNTDGYWIEAVEEVDYIIIHTGERYDFILETNADFGNYWMRAETLEIDRESNGKRPPFESLHHVAEAILQYIDGDLTSPPTIPSTEYLSIKTNSPAIICENNRRCKAVNCPFESFHPSYFTECVNVQNLRLLEPTPREQMPQAYPSSNCPDCLHFINFNFEGDSETSAVNGRNFILPPAPPQTQNEDFQEQAKICSLEANCNPPTLDCLCTHVIDIPYNKTVQFVLTALGSYKNAHPIHLHGHTFHVVHVGYPEYSPLTGFIGEHSKDIVCKDARCQNQDCDSERCTKPGWARNHILPTFEIDSKTIRKDTVYIPAGGYAVINIISNNPGYWFLHCHIEVHQLEGMALVVNEAFEQQQLLTVPDYINKCGDVTLTMGEYEAQNPSGQMQIKVADEEGKSHASK